MSKKTFDEIIERIHALSQKQDDLRNEVNIIMHAHYALARKYDNVSNLLDIGVNANKHNAEMFRKDIKKIKKKIKKFNKKGVK